MTRRYIHANQLKETVSEPTTAVPSPIPDEEVDQDFSIDDLLARGLNDIYRIMRSIRKSLTHSEPTREMVQNLKDCLTMLSDLKKREKELLDAMTDGQVEDELKK